MQWLRGGRSALLSPGARWAAAGAAASYALQWLVAGAAILAAVQQLAMTELMVAVPVASNLHRSQRSTSRAVAVTALSLGVGAVVFGVENAVLRRNLHFVRLLPAVVGVIVTAVSVVVLRRRRE